MKVPNNLRALAIAAGLLSVQVPALAASDGSVTNLSGTLSVLRADGSVRILSRKSEIQSGDTLSTQYDSYAQVRFADGAQITLAPNTTIKVESFRFIEDEPEKDSLVLSMVKGAVRGVTGLVGKRGDARAYQFKTASATLGVPDVLAGRSGCAGAGRRPCPDTEAVVRVSAVDIRGTSFSVADCSGASLSEGPCKGLEPAVYVSVTNGELLAANDAGSANLGAGQSAAIDSAERRPRFLSADPGLQFTPSASFVQSLLGGGATLGRDKLECAVRR
jgi:hypothetical protein